MLKLMQLFPWNVKPRQRIRTPTQVLVTKDLLIWNLKEKTIEKRKSKQNAPELNFVLLIKKRFPMWTIQTEILHKSHNYPLQRPIILSLRNYQLTKNLNLYTLRNQHMIENTVVHVHQRIDLCTKVACAFKSSRLKFQLLIPRLYSFCIQY